MKARMISMNSVIWSIFFWLAISAIVYTYALYPFLVQVLARVFKKKETDARFADHELPSVGIIIPVYNEEKVIAQKMKNLQALAYPWEKLTFYFGSDQSSDASESIIEGFNDPRVRLWVAPARMGKTGIVNALAQQIAETIIFFTDANTMHHPDSLKTLVQHFTDPQVGGVAGHINHVTTIENELAEKNYRDFESRQKNAESQLHSTISAFGGFYTIRRELFKPIPENAYSNDDVLIPMNVIKQGFRMKFDTHAVSQEEMSDDFSIEFRRRIRIGAGNYQALIWLISFFNPMRGWPSFCFLSHKVGRWLSPFFMIVAYGSLIVLAIADTQGVLYRPLCAMSSVLLFFILISPLIKMRMLYNLFYFLAMHIALFLGFFRYIRGIRSAAWGRTER